MNFFVAKFKWLMLLAGLLTCTMFYAAIAPQAALESNFGKSLSGPVAEIIVRNWGALIGLVGIMLIYGAFVPTVRSFALVVAGTSKFIFVVLVLLLGRQFMNFGIGIAVLVDSLWIALFAVYLASPARGSFARSE
ncbi:MAG: hypothetical protein ACT4O9_10840 [Blastocatellia bacterium]